METASSHFPNILQYLRPMGSALMMWKEPGYSNNYNIQTLLNFDIPSRASRLSDGNGNLTKKDFSTILKTSSLFKKSFDKNKDGIVTEVSEVVKYTLFCFEILFFLD